MLVVPELACPSFVRPCSRGAGCLLALLLLAACSSSTDLPSGVITISTGQEPDAWTNEPAAQSVLLEMVQTTRTTLAKVPAPATTVSIGTDGPSSAVASFEATAFDADSNPVMHAWSVPLYVHGFAGAEIALFMGRVGGLSRAPGDLLFPRQHPQLAIFYHGYLLISGGDGAQTNGPALDIYDMARWSVAPEQTPLPKVPKSWAVAEPDLLLIDDTGALWLDTSTWATSAPVAPAGFDFAGVAGGQTILAPDDTQYIVGGTRVTGEPTGSVLRIDTDGSLHAIKLVTPRLGASAAIVGGQLLVVGGSDTGAGAEVSNAAGTGFTPLPFPPDATIGAALVAKDSTTMVLAGGHDPSSDAIAGFRTMDLGCTQDCAQSAIADADFAFDHPQLFALNAGQLLAVGESTTGETHVFTFDTEIGHALNEIALSAPRAGASAFMLPNGQVGVLGGTSLADNSAVSSIELFFPYP